MRTCVIFNPAAKGDKARRFFAQVDSIATQAVLKKTTAAGDARQLAAEAIAEGCDTVIAAGGDGTVNEVLNGIGDANAFARVRLGVLPLGTVNVFALELGIPFNPTKAWALILRGRYTRIDLGWAEFFQTKTTPSPRPSGERDGVRGFDSPKNPPPHPGSLLRGGEGEKVRRYFMQLAGVGLDARAIELVDWQHKKRVGPLAYVIAGLKALREPQPKITVTANNKSLTGELALLGNGKFYGGRIKIFPDASLRDGMLDVCVFPRVNGVMALGRALCTAMFRRLPEGGVQRLRAAEFTVNAAPGAGFELDGEWVGRLPAKFGVQHEKLRVIVP